MGNVLYRKYRSKTLSEIVGQPHITTTLKNAISSGRIAHAYLLTGPRGVGKTSVARIIAREVNGLSAEDEHSHLDIIEIDAASNRRIDEIRELRDKVHNAPAQAAYKVYIIDEVHMLTKEAFNALLKTLEEPPAHAIFILATTEAHKLPETIISRTQRFTFKPIEVAAITAHLTTIAKQEDIQISAGALELIAKHSRGSFRDSLGLLDQARHTQPSDRSIEPQDIAAIIGAPSDTGIDELLEATSRSDAPATIAALQRLLEQGIDAGYIATDVSRRIRGEIIRTGKVSAIDTQVLKDMIMVPSSPDPFLSLEIALLDYMGGTGASPAPSEPLQMNEKNEPQDQDIEQPPSEPDPPVSEKSKPKESTPKKHDTKIDEPAKQTKPGSADAADANAIWVEVLKTLQGAHNTLYGMARMAKPSIVNDTFLLECKYAFHIKRLSDTNHHKILEQAVQSSSGKQYRLSCKLAETKPKETTAKRPDVAGSKDDSVETVSNIFGGAEVLES